MNSYQLSIISENSRNYSQQLQNVRKNIPEIDPVNRSEENLLNVTDEESDAAVEIFGCDCIASINCLRRLLNQLP